MTGPLVTETRYFPVPKPADAGGLLAVEATGVCGADQFYYAEVGAPPRILGHEVVGRIVELGDESAAAWGLATGDRVVLEEYLPCGHCRFCRTSEYRLCLRSDVFAAGPVLRYGSTGVDVEPSLWGGYAEQLYLHPRSVPHRAPEDVPAHVLAMSLPMANGFEWTVRAGGLRPGQSVLVIGPGQQGIGCVVAAVAAGARTVIVAGLESDAHRLSAARRFGATHTVVADQEDLLGAVRQATGGEGVDLVVDAAAGSERTVPAGLAALRKAGRFVLAVGSRQPVPLSLHDLQARNITIKAVRGHSWDAVEWAIATLSAEPDRFATLSSHRFDLDHVDDALGLLTDPGAEPTLHMSVVPG